MINGLNWYWITVMATAPLIGGFLLAYPLWRRGDSIFGNLAGTGVMFASAFGMIWREHVELDRIVQQCIDNGLPCWPEPSAFTRFAVYAFIALFQVFLLFSASLRVEETLRRRDYAPEWR